MRFEECICISCLHQTPRKNCFEEKENEVSGRFWGRVKLQNAAALFQFNKEGNVQKLIHKLKYQGGKEVGVFLGKQLAYAINDSEFLTILMSFAAPLHPKKQKKRGYNQSHFIAKGIKEILPVEIDNH